MLKKPLKFIANGHISKDDSISNFKVCYFVNGMVDQYVAIHDIIL